jgi:hypothetical protein
MKTTLKLKHIIELKKQEYLDLMEKCREEAYEYFDKNIRPLPKQENGEFHVSKEKFYDNDVDAFRHAYTSGVFTQEESALFANLAGIYNEYKGTNPINVQNMDLWNNAVGRKYGKKTTSKKELAEMLKKVLQTKELITDSNDPREYKGLRHINYDPKKPVQVIQESDTGRNEYFLDLSNGNIMDREGFVHAIESGSYPGYLVANIDSISTPMSKPDSNSDNNLG